MVILRTRNKITDFLMILAWASPFKCGRLAPMRKVSVCAETHVFVPHTGIQQRIIFSYFSFCGL